MSALTDDDVHGLLLQRVELGKGSYVLIYEPLPGLIPVVRHRRLSKEKTKLAQELAMERQLCLKVLRAAGACVVRDYVDPDHSAADRDKPPPGFQRLYEEFRDVAQGIAVTNLDRLMRHPFWCEQMIMAYEHDRNLLFITDDSVNDLSTAAGRKSARDKTNRALAEVEEATRRQAARHDQMREKGVPVFAHRPFGLQQNPDSGEWELEPDEAGLINEAASWLLSGQNMERLSDDWLARGIRTPKGGAWCPQTLRSLLVNPRNAGYLKDGRREYKGGPFIHADNIARDDSGERIVARHPQILSLSVWTDVVATYEGRKATYTARRRGLSGILRCNECGASMGGSRSGDPGKWYYICPRRTGVSCGKVRITGAYADKIIGQLIMARARAEGQAEVLADPEPFPKAQALADALAQRTELIRQLNAEEIDSDDYQAETAGLSPLIAALQRESRAWAKANPAPVARMTVPEGNWEDLAVTIQQDLARQYLHQVRVTKSPGGRGSLNPERFLISESDWR